MINRVTRGMAARGELPGRQPGNRHGNGERQYKEELVYFPEYEWPMTRSEYAKLQEARGKAASGRREAAGNVRREANKAYSSIPSFNERGIRNKVTKGWVTLHVGSVLDGKSSDFEFRMPREQADKLIGNKDLSSLEPKWINDNTAYIGIHHLDQGTQHKTYKDFKRMQTNYEKAVDNAVKQARAQYQTQVGEARGQIRGAVSGAMGQIQDAEQAEQSDVDNYNKNAIKDRKAARSTALSMKMGGAI